MRTQPCFCSFKDTGASCVWAAPVSREWTLVESQQPGPASAGLRAESGSGARPCGGSSVGLWETLGRSAGTCMSFRRRSPVCSSIGYIRRVAESDTTTVTERTACAWQAPHTRSSAVPPAKPTGSLPLLESVSGAKMKRHPF